uniref:Transposase (Putative), gypsy type n=1 Tax=Tanacetum cinerariifolium TaxID=118510 RepID=A0A6L2K3U0_TANCI|nr:hypothetical protein [Tanacetum cinerariifolium]
MSAIIDVRCVLTQEALDAFCNTFHIPEEVHHVLPNQDDTMHERLAGKIRLSRHYTLDEETYPWFVHKNEEDIDLFAFIHASDPTKDANIQPVVKAADTIVEDAAPLQSRRQKKRKSIVVDVGGASHPPKKLREDYGNQSEASIGEREDEDHTDSVAEPNLRTIGAPQRFVISSDSSHHFGPTIAEAKVDSLVMSSTPIMTTATTITSTVDSTLVAKEKPVKPSLFAIDSSSAGGADPNTGVFSDQLASMTNGSRLNDGRVCREMVDEFAPPKFFASVHGMKHDQLFTEFNVGAAHQISLSVEVRMCAEYNVKERMRLKSVVEKQDELLNARDGEIENLKAQLLLKEAKFTEAIRLRTQISNLEAVENLADQVHKLEVSSAELQEKITVYDNSISCVIEKGMQSDLAAKINHDTEGRSLADVAVYNPDAKEDFNTALQELCEVEFHLLAKLKSYKDASTENIKNVLCLEGALAEAPGMNDSQLDIEQLKVPIHRSEDQVVLGETSLSFALNVSHSHVERIKKNIAAQRVVPAASVTTTALSITFAFASSIPPISTNDYEIVGVDGQEGAGTDGRVLVDGNVAPFPNVDDVELHIP